LVIFDIAVSLRFGCRKKKHDKEWKKFYRIRGKMIKFNIELIDQKRGFRKLSSKQKLKEEARLESLSLVDIDKEIKSIQQLPKFAFRASKSMSKEEFDKLPKPM